MTQPTHNEFRTNEALSDISLAHFQDSNEFVASKVFPKKNVPKSSGDIRLLDQADTRRNAVQRRAEGTMAAEAGFGIGRVTYRTDEFSVQTPVTDQQMADADDSIEPVMSTTMTLSQWAMIDQEVRWRDAFFRMSDGTNNIWQTNVTGTADGTGNGNTTQWDQDTSNPIEEINESIDEVVEASGIRPNMLIVGPEVYTALINNDEIVDRISGGATPENPAMGQMANLAALFKIDRIFVGNGTHNSADEGVSTPDYGYILGKHALLVHSPPMGPARFSPTSGVVFQWTGYQGSANADHGFTIDSIRDAIRDQTIYRIRAHQQMKLLDNTFGKFFNNIVA